jgi:pimeloyl-ACP methyl ester carboxylesterase
MLSCFSFKKYSGTDYGKDTPKRWGLNYSETGFFTGDSVHISAWEILQDKNNPWIIVVPGFEDNKSDDKVRITVKKLAPYKYNFLLIDLRGFGKSGGVTSFGILEKNDVLAAVKYLRKQYKTKIGLVGFSQGASASILAAASTRDVSGLVLWAPYADFEKEINYFLKWKFAGSRNKIIIWARKNPAKVKSLYESFYMVKLKDNKPETEIKKIKYEILLGHGANDSLIPFSNAQALLNANGNIRFFKSTGDHSLYGIGLGERNMFLDMMAQYFSRSL